MGNVGLARPYLRTSAAANFVHTVQYSTVVLHAALLYIKAACLSFYLFRETERGEREREKERE